MTQKSKNQLSKILEDPHRFVGQTYGANGILASLFRQMLGDLNISISRWGSLMADFIDDARNATADLNQKDRTSMRGNLTKEFSRPQMTWKVFCKGLRFLQIVKIELVIRAHHPNGKTTSHSTVVNLGSRQQLKDLLDDLDKPDSDDDEHQEEDTGHDAP